MAAYREVEVTLFSAQELRDVRVFGGRMSPYAVAWIDPSVRMSCPMDTKGGIDPKWNAKLMLYCEERRLAESEDVVIHVELYDSRSHSGKQIGSVEFSLSELPGKKTPSATAATSDAVFMSLPVRRPSGREQGTLNFSVRIGDLTDEAPAAADEESNLDDGMTDGELWGGCCALPHFHREDEGSLHRAGIRNLCAH